MDNQKWQLLQLSPETHLSLIQAEIVAAGDD